MDDADWAAHYATLLEDVKARVRSAQVRAASSANRELVLLYWSIGRDILARQASLGWGAKVIDRLAADLGRTFPTVKGFSPRNLKYMRAFAEAWPDEDFVQQAAARLPWFHNVAIVERVKDPEIRRFYLEGCIAHGWSRNLLAVQIDTRLHERQGRAATNFATTLPAPHSDLAQQLTKDPYVFDFLTLGPEARERDLERGLLHHLRDFLVEMGVGFAFVGSQVHLEVAGEDFYLDLLFYHLGLRCFVVVELKMGPFVPEYAGKMNFYLSAVDAQRKHPTDQPTIGILLCKGRKDLVVEYALRDLTKPIGVANWETRLVESLPEELAGSLPTVEEMEAELGGETDGGEP
jgi:predicted nuclease of restriction endonuclease-like (RecB) superfamily